jgi:hypothetical protein
MCLVALSLSKPSPNNLYSRMLCTVLLYSGVGYVVGGSAFKRVITCVFTVFLGPLFSKMEGTGTTQAF